MVAEIVNKNSFTRSFLLMFLFSCLHIYAYSQVNPPTDSLKADSLRIIRSGKVPQSEDLNAQYDVGDLFRDVFYPNKTPDPHRKRSGITIILLALLSSKLYAGKHQGVSVNNNKRIITAVDRDAYGVIQSSSFGIKVYKKLSDGSIDASFGTNGYSDPVLMRFFD